MRCSNNLKQLSLATINCADSNDGKLPPGIGLYPGNGSPAPLQSDGGNFLHILPFIEQDNLFKSSLVGAGVDGRNGNNPTYSQWTSQVQNSQVKTLICPSDATQDARGGRASYGANGQIFRHNYRWGSVGLSRFPSTFRDGTSNTVLYAEKLSLCDSGGYPDNFWPDWGPSFSSTDNNMPVGPLAPTPQINPPASPSGNGARCDGGVASAMHTSGINVGLADGSVRFVGASVSSSTWWFALTPAGGETLGSNW